MRRSHNCIVLQDATQRKLPLDLAGSPSFGDTHETPGLIRKVQKSHRYTLTSKGHLLAAALFAAREATPSLTVGGVVNQLSLHAGVALLF